MITRFRRIGLSFIFALGVMLVIPTISQAAQTSDKPIPVYYNDERIEFSIDPISSKGTTLVEFRPIFEKLGLEITWNQVTKTIGGYKEGLSVELQLGNFIAKVNDIEVRLQVAPMVVNDRTVIPLRFVGEAAGSYVQWDQINKVIHLYRISPTQVSTTTNYSIVEGRTPTDIKWLRFDIYKEGSEDFVTVYAQPEDGIVNTEIYLPDGQGVYNIMVFQTQLSYKETTNYVYNTKFSLINLGESGLRFDKLLTNDSQVRLYGELQELDKTIVLFIQREDSQVIKRLFLEPVNQRIDKDIFLTSGEGTYVVEMYTTEEPVTSETFNSLYLMKSYSVTNNDSRDMDLVPSEMVESEHEEIIALAKQITLGLSSDREKSLRIHDWVASNVDYDVTTYITDRVDTALEVLRRRLTDCDGYARLNIALHRAVGIKARIVIGSVIDPTLGETWTELLRTVPNHAWNEVFIEERWVTQDPTWNAGYVGSDDIYVRDLSHRYYDPAPELFMLDHYEINNEEDKYE